MPIPIQHTTDIRCFGGDATSPDDSIGLPVEEIWWNQHVMCKWHLHYNEKPHVILGQQLISLQFQETPDVRVEFFYFICKHMILVVLQKKIRLPPPPPPPPSLQGDYVSKCTSFLVRNEDV